MRGAQCIKFFEDKISSRKTGPAGARRGDAVPAPFGDTVVYTAWTGLARNLHDLRRLVHELTSRGVGVQFLTEQLTFTGEDSPMANLLLSVTGAPSPSSNGP